MKNLPEGIYNYAGKEINLIILDENTISIDVWDENNVEGDSCLCSVQIDLKNKTINVNPYEFKLTIDVNKF